jgi:hypothetical protein
MHDLKGYTQETVQNEEQQKYLVAAADHLLHSKSESKKGVLMGLAMLGDASLKTTNGGVNHNHSTVRSHVLDEVTVSRGIISDHAVVLGCLKLPHGNIAQP